jgi:hypothetical protein
MAVPAQGSGGALQSETWGNRLQLQAARFTSNSAVAASFSVSFCWVIKTAKHRNVTEGPCQSNDAYMTPEASVITDRKQSKNSLFHVNGWVLGWCHHTCVHGNCSATKHVRADLLRAIRWTHDKLCKFS